MQDPESRHQRASTSLGCRSTDPGLVFLCESFAASSKAAPNSPPLTRHCLRSFDMMADTTVSSMISRGSLDNCRPRARLSTPTTLRECCSLSLPSCALELYLLVGHLHSCCCTARLLISLTVNRKCHPITQSNDKITPFIALWNHVIYLKSCKPTRPRRSSNISSCICW